jgi:hypothetical protein
MQTVPTIKIIIAYSLDEVKNLITTTSSMMAGTFRGYYDGPSQQESASISNAYQNFEPDTN